MKYILVDNNNILYWGPRDWSKRSLEGWIQEDFEESVVLPDEAPTSKYQVTENILIYPIIDQTPSYDMKLQVLAGPYFTYDDNFATMTYNILPKNVDILKSELKQVVASNRYIKETSGTKVIIQGKEISVTTNRVERDIFAQALLLGSTNNNWKFGDCWLTLSQSDLQLIVDSIVSVVQTAFDWENNKVNEIDSCTTIEELGIIDLGYPEYILRPSLG